MKSHELVVLLPCHTLTDFPYFHEGQAAENMLACYTALWHPALVAQARRMPAWAGSGSDTGEFSDKLLLLTRLCRDDMPGYWPDEARGRGALVVETDGDEPRELLVQRALELLECPSPPIDAGTLADFFSLGLCHLLVELLTVQMRYSSLIDEEHFSRQLVAAAEAALEGDNATAHDKLAACFDALSEARDHFYPVNSYLVDLTLVASTTIGASLRRELQCGVPGSLLLDGSVLSAMAQHEPATLMALREALAAERFSLVGGEQEEQQLPLRSPEQVLANFLDGLEAFQRHLGTRPKIFGRRRFGLSPRLPELLEMLDFAGALHFTLDDGHFPLARQSCSRWEGFGAATVTALFRVPLDASRAESVISFPQQMSNAMDMDHAAVVTFAHWPGVTTPWYEDLRRSAAFAPAVGRFVTLEALLQATEPAGESERFSADQYRSPYLAQDVAAGLPDPISRSIKFHAEAALQHCRSTIAAFTQLVRGSSDVASVAPAGSEVAGLRDSESDACESPPGFQDALCRFAEVLPRTDRPAAAGCLVFNPLSFARRAVVRVDQLASPPAVEPPVLAVGEVSLRREVLVDLPPLGYAWLEPDVGQSWSAPKGKPLAEPLLLRNEMCEVSIHAQTGGIQSIFTPGYRGNRISQQLAVRSPGAAASPGERWRDPDEAAQYSTMVAESIEVSIAGAMTGEIVSRGKLVGSSGEPLAIFRQSTRLERGSQVVWIDVELEPVAELAADPWHHYIAARFAWSGAPEIFRGVGLVAEATSARRLESPDYIELRSARTRTTILSGGVPYHRLVGDRALDSILLVRGELARRFSLGIALDLLHPHMAALEMQAPAMVLNHAAAAPVPANCWLFHLDAKNVVATHWEPRLEGQRVVGLRVRLLETGGRAVHCGLHSFRQIAAARRLNMLGRTLSVLQAESDKVMIDLAAGQWLHLELDWK